MSETVSFTVWGLPQAQGSMRGFNRGGKVILTSTNRNLGDWRRLIADAAQEHAHMFEGPVTVSLTFSLPKPKSHPKTKVVPHTKRPDLDKLIRAVLDALTGVMFNDDSQVTSLHAHKHYSERPGVNIVVCSDMQP